MDNMVWVYRYDSPNVFNELGRPEIRSILKDNGITTYIDEFDKNLRGKYFCPGCGGKSTRSPLEKDTSRDGKKAYYKHEQNQASSDCPLYVKSRPGNQYLSEKESDRFVDHDSLVVCPKWSEVDKGFDDGTGDKTYEGITEDDWGEKLNSPIGRHYGGRVSVALRITSVRKIAQNYDNYIMKSIAFPNEDKPRMIRDIMVNLNKEGKVEQKLTEEGFADDMAPRLYTGRISSCGSLTKRKYINVDVNDIQYSIYVWPEDFDSRKIQKDRILLFYGAFDYNDYTIKLDHLGQFDLIPKNQESKFGF